MNCRDAQKLLSLERDEVLDSANRVGLDAHLAGCGGCRHTRDALAGTIDGWRASVKEAAVPDEVRAWQDFRRTLHATGSAGAREPRHGTRWTLSLAAAAALALAAVLAPRWRAEPEASVARLQSARADFVEVPNNTSSVVYLDDQTGWLVVWAVDDNLPTGI